MPGEGPNSCRQNRRLFLFGPRGIYLAEPGVGFRWFLFAYSQVAGVALRKSGKCFSSIHGPPGFGGMNLALPRATREAS